MHTAVLISITGQRKNGEATHDIVELSADEWTVVLESLRKRIESLDKQVATMQQQPGGHSIKKEVILKLMEERIRLVEVLCTIDI